MSAHPDANQPHNPFEDENDASLGDWCKEFIAHYWPIIFFATCFVLMMAAGLVLMSGETGLILAGLAVVAVFGLAITFTFLAPVLLAPLLIIALLAVAFIYPENTYNKTPTALLGIGMLGMAIAGTAYFLAKIKPSKTETADEAAVAIVADTASDLTEEADSEPEIVEERGPKPVAFDLGIAAKGVTIIFGTESGNAEGLAEVAKGELESDGHAVQMLDAGVVDFRHLKAFANLLIITSTWGEGDPPSNAIELVGDMKNDALSHDTSGIQFSVLSLGDTNYELFCQCGKDFDSYLEKAGGKRFLNRVDCDVDYDQPFQDWVLGVRNALKGGLNTTAEYQEEQALAGAAA